MIPFWVRKMFKNTQRDLPQYVDIQNYLSVGKIYSLWSKRRKDWSFKFKLKSTKHIKDVDSIGLVNPTYFDKMNQLHRFKHKPCALESFIRPGYMISFQVYLFHCCCILSLYFYNNVLHLTVFGWSITLFFRICVFAIKFWGRICPTSTHLGIPIDVQISILGSARVICSIVHAQVRDHIHRKVCVSKGKSISI